MAKMTLAVKYRPKVFEDVCEQKSITTILKEQIKTKTFQHAYLFSGPAGTGKTTSARIFANEINEGEGTPIEIDAASNSGVDNIRNIIEDSKRKPLDSEYKVYIVDECHSLSNGAWQAMLKLLEEPPKFSIFILCTTDPQKIPATIISRVQRYQFNKISTETIQERLKFILGEELNGRQHEWEPQAISYIAKTANGGMRDAITMMDKCLSLSTDLTVENVVSALGIGDYKEFFLLINYLISSDKEAIRVVEDVFSSGKDLKQFFKKFFTFSVNCFKYCIFQDYKYIDIPKTKENEDILNDIISKKDAVYDVMELARDINACIKWEPDPLPYIEEIIFNFLSGGAKE